MWGPFYCSDTRIRNSEIFAELLKYRQENYSDKCNSIWNEIHSHSHSYPNILSIHWNSSLFHMQDAINDWLAVCTLNMTLCAYLFVCVWIFQFSTQNIPFFALNNYSRWWSVFITYQTAMQLETLVQFDKTKKEFSVRMLSDMSKYINTTQKIIKWCTHTRYTEPIRWMKMTTKRKFHTRAEQKHQLF